MDQDILEDINCIKPTKLIIRKTSKFSLKVFAIFVTAMLLLSMFVVADIEHYIEIPEDLPWELTFYPGPLGNHVKLTFKNASEDTPIVVRFENVITNTTLVKDGIIVGNIIKDITNFYIFTIINGTNPYIRFFVDDGVTVKIDKIDETRVEDINKSHIFGDTFYSMGGKYIADLGFESLEGKEITLNTTDSISYIGIIEYPAFVESICRYGELNNSEVTFFLPPGTKTLRIVSDSVAQYELLTKPVKNEDIAVIDVIATRDSDGAAKYARTITPVGQYYGLNISCDDPSNTVAAGNSTIFEFEIENLGNGNDTIDLEANSEWNISFVDPVIEFDFQNELKYAYMIATAPSGSENQNKTIQINATSRGNQSQKVMINITLYSKSPSFSYDFDSDENIIEIYPKQTIWHFLEINNTGNVEDTYDLGYDTSIESQYWDVFLDLEEVRVDTNQTKLIKLIVSAPLNATNASFYINVSATSHNISNPSQFMNLTVNVVKIYGVDISPDYQIKSDCPIMAAVYFPIEVQNSGNTADTINLSIESGEGFFTWANGTPLRATDPPNASVSLDPWEEITVYLEVPTPNTYDTVKIVEVNGTSENGSSITEIITAELITMSSGGSPNEDNCSVVMPVVFPGDVLIPTINNEKYSYNITITNTGDHADNFTLYNEISYSSLIGELYDRSYNETRHELILNQSIKDDIYPFDSFGWSLTPSNDPWSSQISVVNESDPFRIFLDVNESKTIVLNVTAANVSPLGEFARVTLRANATINSSAFDLFKKYFLLTQSNISAGPGGGYQEILPYGAYPQMNDDELFYLYCEEPVSAARPGDSTTYKITIQNSDNVDMSFNLTTYGVPSNWNASLDDSSITVGKYNTSEVNLTVTTISWGLLPSDSDLDGLNDSVEVNSYNTSQFNPDSDNDMFWDGAEVDYWLLRGVDIENISIYINNNDIDNDTLLDGDEILHLTNINGSSDTDALSDFYEIYQYFTYEKKEIEEDYYPHSPVNATFDYNISDEDSYRLVVNLYSVLGN